MKTQILRLDPHDDIISARDKMGWSQTGRILLVWPDRGLVLARRYDLILLQRHSQKLGAQLALVTHESDVIYHAGQLGIPVYKSVQQAQKTHWRVDRRRKRSPLLSTAETRERPDLEALRQNANPTRSQILSRTGVRLAVFTTGVIALLAIAVVLYPQAEIHLQPATRDQEVILEVRASPDSDRVNLSGSIPARWRKVVVEGRDSTTTDGMTRVPLEHASGQIIFTNLTESPVAIPDGTVVGSAADPPVRFKTIRGGTVPAGVGSTLSLPIVALLPGSSGNLPAGALIAIEGQSGANLSATNRAATRGGSDQSMAIANDANRQTLYESLEASLRQTALEELQASLPEGNLLFTSTITISEVLEKRYDPAEEIPSDQVGLNLRIEYQVLEAAQEDLNQLAAASLNASLPKGYIPADEIIQISQISEPVLERSGRQISWKMRARRMIKAELAAVQAINQVLGQSPSVAASRLATKLSLAAQPSFDIQPAWWPRLPILPLRIHVSSD